MASQQPKPRAVSPPDHALVGQAQIFNSLIRFFAGEGSDMHRVLCGYAGTGKTWLTVHLAHAAVEMGLKVAVCAPTHKAIAVIKQKMAEARTTKKPSPWTGTLHALLGLRLKEGFDGKMDLRIHRTKGKFYFDDADLVIIDEASMIGTVLLPHILQNQRGGHPRVLYVGDPGQLLPIETDADAKGDNDMFDVAGLVVDENSFEPPVFRLVPDRDALTEIVRQKSTGRPHPIVQFAQVIRGYIEGETPGVFHPDAIMAYLAEHGHELEGKIRVARTAKIGSGTVSLRRHFPGKDIRAIAWHNYAVDKHNAFIHSQLPDLYGPHDVQAPFWPGETIVAREAMYAFDVDAHIAVLDDNAWERALSPDPEGLYERSPRDKKKAISSVTAVVVQNNTEMTVRSCVEHEHPYLGIAGWRITAILPDDGQVVEFYAAHDTKEHRQMVRATWDKAKNTGPGSARNFCRAWAVTRACAPVQHSYSVTAYKSQGSTFFCSVIDLADLYKMARRPKGAEAYHRALYVAVTRASERVWLCF